MKENNSPWLYQLARTRPGTRLNENLTTDVLIIGGGIAGISTLYFTLKNTNARVVLLEAKQIAHGATGHNAGYVTAEFEKPYKEMIKEHGKEKAFAGIRAIENSWQYLEELVSIAGSDLPYEKTISHGAYRNIDEFIDCIEDMQAIDEIQKMSTPAFVTKESKWFEKLPPHVQSVCKEIPQQELLSILEINDDGYCAAVQGEAAVTNSALLSDRILLHCLEKYSDRVTVYEHSFVQGIELDKDSGKAFCDEYTVAFKEVVLATNGFEHFYIKNQAGGNIDTKFHHHLRGVVGYMTGYLTSDPVESATRYYYPEINLSLSPESPAIDPYFYISRRNFKTDKHSKLVSIGGPEVSLQERELYFTQFDVDDSFYDLIDEFMSTQSVPKTYEREFKWHGLMGYTTSGLRLVGREPANPILLYNIGCNGIGILTSIYGGKKISDHLAGKDVPPSIFDPKMKE